MYRRRRKEAAELAARGKTAKQIAKKLSVPGSGISAEAVQRWIGES
jgi:DNA-binding NarL/FixJ family response regulator